VVKHQCFAVNHDPLKTRKYTLTEVVDHNSVPASVNVTSTLNFHASSFHSCSDLSFNAMKLINSECRNFLTCLQASTPTLLLPASLNFGFPS
jgi:hypothetical protein